jgi:hypothetical protein
MKHNLAVAIILISALSGITGCDEQKSSQVITLYKGSIASGNSIVNFVDYEDPNGSYAQGFCEDLKKLYEKKWRETYYCSSTQFKKFLPKIKWHISD